MFSLVAGGLLTVLTAVLLAALEQRPPNGADLRELATFGALCVPGLFVLLLVRNGLGHLVERLLDRTLGRWVRAVNARSVAARLAAAPGRAPLSNSLDQPLPRVREEKPPRPRA